MSAAKPLRVALIGGGIGGLGFAIALQAQREEGGAVELIVYEGARQFEEIGAGIGMGDNAFSAMAYLGLEKEYQEIMDPCDKCQWRYGEKDRHWGDDGKLGETLLLHSTVHRAELLNIMVKKLPTSVARFGKRLVSYTVDESKPSSAITISFTDGTSETCDVLVGGDGVKSVVRNLLFAGDDNIDATPVYSGTTAARGLLDMDLVKSIVGEEEATRPQMYLGLNQHLLIFPIQHSKTVNVVAFKSDRSTPNPTWAGGDRVQTITSEALLGGWSEWSDKCQNILKAIEKPSQWALNELRDLPTYSKGSVVLLGDAAHAMLPHQGAGASQALEDGIILASLLGHSSTTASTVPHALATYNKLRVERATRVKNTSCELGRIMEFATVEFGDKKEKLIPNFMVRYDYIWEWRAESAVKEALALLLQ